MRRHRAKLGLMLAVILGAWGFQVGHAEGTISCRASVLRIQGDAAGPLSTLNVEPIVANNGASSCATETKGLLASPPPLNGEEMVLPSGLGTVRVLYASTNGSANDTSSSEAGVAKVHLTIPSAPTIDVELLTAQASATCDANDRNAAPDLASSSEVLKVTIAGTVVQLPEAINGGGHTMDISLGPLGVLHLNYTETDTTSVTQRALFLDTGLVDVTIAEAQAGYTGATPCQQPDPPKQCEDGNDNDGDGKIDEEDPGCHSDGNPDNPDSYVPTDDNEEDVTDPECSDGVDNDGDGATDFPDDPGCDSPDDDSELGDNECDDGIDNDGNGDTDFPDDPDCDGPDDNSESGGDGNCDDGVDNDDAEDDLADEEDPDCHTDYDPDNPDSYDPNLNETCDEFPADTETSADSGDQEDDLGQADDEDCEGSERDNPRPDSGSGGGDDTP